MVWAKPYALSGSDEAIKAVPCGFRGYTVRETGGANAATVRIFDHASTASGTLLATIRLAASASETVMTDGIQAVNGIYVDYGGTGAVEGSVYIA